MEYPPIRTAQRYEAFAPKMFENSSVRQFQNQDYLEELIEGGDIEPPDEPNPYLQLELENNLLTDTDKINVFEYLHRSEREVEGDMDEIWKDIVTEHRPTQGPDSLQNHHGTFSNKKAGRFNLQNQTFQRINIRPNQRDSSSSSSLDDSQKGSQTPNDGKTIHFYQNGNLQREPDNGKIREIVSAEEILQDLPSDLTEIQEPMKGLEDLEIHYFDLLFPNDLNEEETWPSRNPISRSLSRIDLDDLEFDANDNASNSSSSKVDQRDCSDNESSSSLGDSRTNSRTPYGKKIIHLNIIEENINQNRNLQRQPDNGTIREMVSVTENLEDAPSDLTEIQEPMKGLEDLEIHYFDLLFPNDLNEKEAWPSRSPTSRSLSRIELDDLEFDANDNASNSSSSKVGHPSLPRPVSIIDFNSLEFQQEDGISNESASKDKELRESHQDDSERRVTRHFNGFLCDICDKKFSKRCDLYEHKIKTHLYVARCDKCQKTFNSKDEMLSHRVSHSGERPLHCPHCEATFRTKDFLQSHVGTHFRSDKTANLKKPSNRPEISIDSISIDPRIQNLFAGTSKELTRDHQVDEVLLAERFSPNDFDDLNIRSVEVEQRFNCDKCERTFRRLSDLKRHFNIHRTVDSFQCTECEKVFGTFHAMKMHRLGHNSDRPFGCDVCQKKFSRMMDLKKHELSHFETRKIKCERCGLTFTKRRDLNNHLKKYVSLTSEESRTSDNVGTVLGEETGLNNYLKLNILLKVADKNFICEQPFGNETDLRKHKSTHSSGTPFKCDPCSKSFATLQNLTRHKLSHSVAKTLACHLCTKKFKYQNSLEIHVKNHEKEINNNFQCDTCRRKYKTEEKLRKHYVERAFFCTDKKRLRKPPKE